MKLTIIGGIRSINYFIPLFRQTTTGAMLILDSFYRFLELYGLSGRLNQRSGDKSSRNFKYSHIHISWFTRGLYVRQMNCPLLFPIAINIVCTNMTNDNEI